MPSDAPVSEVFDMAGKTGLMMLEILKLFASRSKVTNKHSETVKQLADKHFGTGEVSFKKMLKREGLSNLDFKSMPADRLDAFEQVAKEAGLPFSVAKFYDDPSNPGQQMAMVAFSKSHSDAFHELDSLVNGRDASQPEIQAAVAAPLDRTIYEDVVAGAGHEYDVNACDIVLFGMDDQDLADGVRAMREQGIAVFECAKDLDPDFLAQNPDLRNYVGILRHDFDKACQVLDAKGIEPTTDALIVPQTAQYTPFFETIRHQQAYDKQQASREHDAPEVSQSINAGHHQITNLTPEQVANLREQCAAQDISFCVSQGTSGLADVLISDPDLPGAAAALASVAPARMFQEVPQQTYEQAWLPHHKDEIERMDLHAQQRAIQRMQTKTAQIQQTQVQGEYMHPSDPAMQQFNQAAALQTGNLGSQDWNLLTKSDAEVEVVPIDPANFGTFLQTVGTDVDFAASQANGQFAVAFDKNNRAAVMDAVNHAQPGLYPIRLVPEIGERDPSTINIRDVIDQNHDTVWGENQPIYGNADLNQMFSSYGPQNILTMHTSVQQAREIATDLYNQQSVTPISITPGNGGTAYLTFHSADKDKLAGMSPALANAAPVYDGAAPERTPQIPQGRMNSGRSLRDRAKNPLQQNGQTLGSRMVENVKQMSKDAAGKIVSTIKNTAKSFSGASR